MPTWTLSLATIAAANALISLGIVVLARTGNVSFGQGLFYAAGGYGVALIANGWGLTDAVAQVIIGAVCGGLLGLVIGPLIARYSGIFFGMLTLALSMVFYGALVKTTALGGSDGFNVGRPSLFGMSLYRSARGRLHAVCGVRRHDGLCRYRGNHPVPVRVRAGQPCGSRKQSARRISRPFRQPDHLDQFRDRRDLCRRQRRLCADGAAAYRSAIRLLDHIGRIRLRGGARGKSERCRGVCRFDGAGTGSLFLEPLPPQHLAARARCFPARRDPVSAARHRLALDPGQAPEAQSRCQSAGGRKRGGTVTPVLSVRGLDKRFGAVVAADALTFDIPAGQKISLIGANGAGKTTFVNMVTGYLEPDCGSISLDGLDIGGRSPRNVARLGISRSFQIPQLFIELTAAENLTVAISGAGKKALSFHSPSQAQRRHDKAVELLAAFWPCRPRRASDLGTGRRRAQNDRHRHGAGAATEIAVAG